MRSISRLVVFLSFLFLAGCANELELGAPQKPQHFVYQAPRQRAKMLYRLSTFAVLGAFGVKVEGSERIITYNWSHEGANLYTLKLATPGDFYQVALRDFHNNITYWRDPTHFTQIHSLKSFMRAQMGWYIPLNNFYYWMRGIAAPSRSAEDKPVMRYDQFGHVTVLKQSGWVLHYQRYIRYGQYDLPTLINVMSPRLDVIRIAIKQWLLASTTHQTYSHTSLSKQNQQLLRSL